jgi:hypothetical protein
MLAINLRSSASKSTLVLLVLIFFILPFARDEQRSKRGGVLMAIIHHFGRQPLQIMMELVVLT